MADIQSKTPWKEVSRMFLLIFGFWILNFVMANLLLWNSKVDYTYAEREILGAALMVAFNICVVIFSIESQFSKRIKKLENQLAILQSGNKGL